MKESKEKKKKRKSLTLSNSNSESEKNFARSIREYKSSSAVFSSLLKFNYFKDTKAFVHKNKLIIIKKVRLRLRKDQTDEFKEIDLSDFKQIRSIIVFF